MWAIYYGWIIATAVILLLMALAGRATTHVSPGNRLVPAGGWLNILIDSRGRYSLSRLQVVVWTAVLIGLAAGVVAGRLVHGVPNALDISIPGSLFGLLGVSLGSTVLSSAIKAAKGQDPAQAAVTAASGPGDPPHIGQVMLTEQGTLADQTVDIGKFQNLIITLVLVAAYVLQAVAAIRSAGTAAHLSALPGLSSGFVTLLGISHAGYLGLKLPPAPAGAQMSGLTLDRLSRGEVPSTRPRNPRTALVWDTIHGAAAGTDHEKTQVVAAGSEDTQVVSR